MEPPIPTDANDITSSYLQLISTRSITSGESESKPEDLVAIILSRMLPFDVTKMYLLVASAMKSEINCEGALVM